MSLGQGMGSLRGLRLGGEGLRRLCDLEKWKISDFPCFIVKSNYLSNEEIML